MISRMSLTSTFLATLVVLLPSMAISQSMRQAIAGAFADEWESMDIAEITILPDHQSCNGPGEVAFSLRMEATDLDFRLQGDGWTGTVRKITPRDNMAADSSCIIGQLPHDRIVMRPEKLCSGDHENADVLPRLVVPEAEGCFLTLRRGGEAVRQEVACGEVHEPASLNSLLYDARLALDVSISAEICQSLTGIGIVDSEWLAQIETASGKEVYEGVLGYNATDESEDLVTPTVEINASRADHGLEAISEDHPELPFYLDPMRFATYSFSFEIENAPIPGTEEFPVTLRAGKQFRVQLE